MLMNQKKRWNNSKQRVIGGSFHLNRIFSTIQLQFLSPPSIYQKSALRPSNWPQRTPKFRDFSYFYMNYLMSKNFFWFFTLISGVQKGGVLNTPRHLTYIFDPATNRVKKQSLCCISQQHQSKDCHKSTNQYHRNLHEILNWLSELCYVYHLICVM